MKDLSFTALLAKMLATFRNAVIRQRQRTSLLTALQAMQALCLCQLPFSPSSMEANEAAKLDVAHIVGLHHSCGTLSLGNLNIL